MFRDLGNRIERLAADRESGASEILDEAIAILREALASRTDVTPIARALCFAQPSMAPIWNAALTAIASPDDVERFEVFAQRVARAPAALARFAVALFADIESRSLGKPLRIVTISFSRSVLRVLEALHQQGPVQVACAESRPALEGRRLAVRLARAAIPVTCVADASIGHALHGAEVVLVGADAVAPEWFLNKCGTWMLAAAAVHVGVPVYVVASRDKFVSRALSERLVVRDGSASEVWEDAPAGVTIANPLFERVPLQLIASLITDFGAIGVGVVSDVCRAMADRLPVELLDQV
jgi:translation initiation factor 2B subunit (eIF-2B alpha/beta/delta family)